MSNLATTCVVDDKLIKDGITLVSVGDEFTERMNPYRGYRCTSIDLQNINFEKISVGKFEPQELGKSQRFLTTHFINEELGLNQVIKTKEVTNE